MSDPLAHRVAEHVAKLTGERRRPRLELLLLEALCDIGRARRTDYYRLQVAPGETLCWKAASCLNGHSTVFDDGINVPQDLLSLAAMPDAARAVGGGHAVIVGDGSARRMIWPISAAGSSAGVVILESARDASRPLAPFASGACAAARKHAARSSAAKSRSRASRSVVIAQAVWTN